MNAQDPEVMWKSKQPVAVNGNGKMIVAKRRTPNKFIIVDTKDNTESDKKKLPKELEIHSSILPVKNKWLYLHDAEKKSFSKAKYNIVELNENGSFSFKVPAIECEEKIGSFKFLGVKATTSLVPFDARLTKSKNEDYISCISSKIYGSYSRQAGMVNLKDYRITEEITHFSVFNSKLELLKKGSFKPGITRGDIVFFSTYVSNVGDLYLVYGLKQEYGKTSNRLLLVKISMEEESVQRITFHLPKFNTQLLGTVFEDDRFQFTGFVDPFETEEKDIQGVFYATIDNSIFQMKDVNVVLFSEEQKTQMNEMYKKDKKVLPDWEAKENEVYSQIRASALISGDDVLGIVARYYAPVHNEPVYGSVFIGYTFSSHFLIRFGTNKKSIFDITSLGTPKGFGANMSMPMVMDDKLYYSYTTEKEIKVIEIPTDLSDIGEHHTISSTVIKKNNLTYGYRGYVFNKETMGLYASVNVIHTFKDGQHSTLQNRIALFKVTLPK